MAAMARVVGSRCSRRAAHLASLKHTTSDAARRLGLPYCSSRARRDAERHRLLSHAASGHLPLHRSLLSTQLALKPPLVQRALLLSANKKARQTAGLSSLAWKATAYEVAGGAFCL